MKTRDTLLRPMMVLTPDGLKEINIRDSRTATLISRHDQAIKHFLETGDDSQLRKFRNRGVRVGNQRYRFETDPKSLEERARRGELSFESIYASVT